MGTESLVLGGDLGGTSTRILVVGTDGRVRGRSTTGGGNPISHPAGAAAALAGALRAALAGIDPAGLSRRWSAWPECRRCGRRRWPRGSGRCGRMRA